MLVLVLALLLLQLAHLYFDKCSSLPFDCDATTAYSPKSNAPNDLALPAATLAIATKANKASASASASARRLTIVLHAKCTCNIFAGGLLLQLLPVNKLAAVCCCVSQNCCRDFCFASGMLLTNGMCGLAATRELRSASQRACTMTWRQPQRAICNVKFSEVSSAFHTHTLIHI